MSESLFGKYRLLAELGHGGMADVYLAVVAGPAGSGFNKLTVVKRLRAGLEEDPEFIAMLGDEARLAARLNHPNVVQTLEFGEVGAHCFIAMEFLDGQPLHRVQYRAAAVLKGKGIQTFPEDLGYVAILDTLAGLHHAHELVDYDGTSLGVVHRDVDPHNIFVTYDGQVKVVDFGIAKAAGRASETQHGIVKGKVRYMAPEQAVGLSVDRRADVFSAAIVLWEIAVGRRMWHGMDDQNIVQRLLTNDIPSSPRAVSPEVPERIDAICRKALAARPEERYLTAEAFRDDLERFLSESGRLDEARRKLGPAVAGLFADKRSELKAAVDAQLKKLQSRASMADFLVVPVSASSTSSSASQHASRSSTGPSTVSNEAPQPIAPDHPAARGERTHQRNAKAAWVVAAGLALVIVALSVNRSRAGAAAVEAGSQQAAPSMVDDIAVALDAKPTSAHIKLDGRDLGSSFRGRLPRDRNVHHVLIEADGFAMRTEALSLTDNLTREFRLEPNPRAAEPATPVTAASAALVRTGVTGGLPAPAVPSPTAAPDVSVVTPAPAQATENVPEPVTTHPETSGRRRRDIDNNDPWAAGREGQSQ